MKDKKKIAKIEKDYKEGFTYNELAKKYKLTYNQVTYLIKKQNWKRESNLSITHIGNTNAIGNSGGPGAPEGNKRALTTGEYETILQSALTEEEQILFENIEIQSKRALIEREYKMLRVREHRISKRITAIQNKEKDMNVERIVKRQYNSNSSNEIETVTEATNVINPLQKLEDSLTRVQEALRRCIDSLHKMENDDRKLELDIIRLEMEAAKEDSTNTEDLKDDSFIKALNETTEGVWNDYTEDE